MQSLFEIRTVGIGKTWIKVLKSTFAFTTTTSFSSSVALPPLLPLIAETKLICNKIRDNTRKLFRSLFWGDFVGANISWLRAPFHSIKRPFLTRLHPSFCLLHLTHGVFKQGSRGLVRFWTQWELPRGCESNVPISA